MALSSPARRTLLIVAGLVLLGGLGVAGYFLWFRPMPLPGPETQVYQDYAEAFEVGLAALDVGRHELADDNLSSAINRIPQEPAGWANRGLLRLRRNQLSEAESDLKRAHELAPNSPEIEALLGLLADLQGKSDQAVEHLRKAVKQKPEDLAAVFKLAGLVKKAGTKESDTEYQELMEDILRVQPNNLMVLVMRAKIAALRGDEAALKESLERFTQLSAGWSSKSRSRLDDVKEAARGPLPGDVPSTLDGLDNALKSELGYQRSANALLPESAILGEPLRHFVRLAPLSNTPAPADLELTFTSGPVSDQANLAGNRWDVLTPVWLTSGGKPALFVANAKQIRRADAAGFVQDFPSGKNGVAPTAHGILPIDWNNDFRTDLLLAGAGGLRFMQQNRDGTFTDVTAKTKLGAELDADYVGAWAADVEMDGDLDIVLAPRAGPVLVLRNNRDGTFNPMRLFPGVEGLRAFVWADLDNDGAPEAILLDGQGKLHVFANERLGQFRRRAVPKDVGRLLALAAVDLDDDGVFDLLALRDDGTLLRISDQDKGTAWDVAEVGGRVALGAGLEPGAVQLFAADLDNNGGVDLVVAAPRGGRAWLNTGPGKFSPLEAILPPRVMAVEDVTANGRLDLLGISDAGQPLRFANKGSRTYHWHDVISRSANDVEGGKPVLGDNRVNSFGVGSEVEARTGTLVQKVIITSPRTRFGLGDRKKVDLLRFVWTNGASQVEFDKPADEAIRVEQRLSGSCPFLFAHDGKRVNFVTDFLWSSPLGMYINAQKRSGRGQTLDWINVRGDQLAPVDGKYDLRIQANLWETHFIDHASLIVVDHPADTEILVDERFLFTPTAPELQVMTLPKPVARAWDHHGTDITELVRGVDGRYLDTCGRGRFQGVTRDHWVEVDLGEDAPRTGPVWLIARGWIHPTDSSINVAIAQGDHDPPRGLSLEVPDGKGGWKVGRPDLGFPAGKNKTCLIRLDGIEGEGVSRRFRLRTNMEIFWDGLHYATGLDAKRARQQRLAPETAELRYRGFLEMTRANDSSPELPHYDKVVQSPQHWRDLIGYHTRFGDVRELLEKVDDRYVIMNAGDEIALRFAAPPAPPAGWKRDFVFVSDGWEKDGNLNTAYSKTVLPLPYHGQESYDRPPGALEDDPVYRRFPEDWRKYHTRYVTPFEFERGLRAFQRPRP